MNIKTRFYPLKLKNKTYPKNISAEDRIKMIYKDNKQSIDKFCLDNDLNIKTTLSNILQLAKEKDLQKYKEQNKQMQPLTPSNNIRELPTIKLPRNLQIGAAVKKYKHKIKSIPRRKIKSKRKKP